VVTKPSHGGSICTGVPDAAVIQQLADDAQFQNSVIDRLIERSSGLRQAVIVP
jgi:hypothetical protein